MVPSIDAPMIHRPPFKVDNAATARILRENRARNKAATEEFEAGFEKISARLRTWQIALHRNTQFLDAFKVVE